MTDPIADSEPGGDPEVPLEIDVREPWELEICALPDSRNLPMAQIPQRHDELPRDRILVVLCHHGMRSRQVTGWLRAHDYGNAVNLSGGIDAWARVVDPTVPVYKFPKY